MTESDEDQVARYFDELSDEEDTVMQYFDSLPDKSPTPEPPSSPSENESFDEWVQGLEDENDSLDHLQYEDADMEPLPERTLRAIREKSNHPNIASPLHPDYILHNDTPAEHNDAGTLDWLIKRKIGQNHPRSEVYGILPEALIWHTLVSLLRAVHYLHTGGRSSEEAWANPYWQPIVHTNINPLNISYEEPHDDTTGYKTCQLGGFNRCIFLPYMKNLEDETVAEKNDRQDAFLSVTVDGLTNDPQTYNDTGFQPPDYFISNDTPNEPGFGSGPCPASDLWSIGAVVIAMMSGRNAWDYILEAWFIGNSTGENHRGKRKEGCRLVEKWQTLNFHDRMLICAGNPTGLLARNLPKKYSARLRCIVESLMNVNPLERGTALEALLDAERLYGEWLQ